MQESRLSTFKPKMLSADLVDAKPASNPSKTEMASSVPTVLEVGKAKSRTWLSDSKKSNKPTKARSPMPRAQKKDVRGGSFRSALSPKKVSPKTCIGRELMPEINGSIWRPMSPLPPPLFHTAAVHPDVARRTPSKTFQPLRAGNQEAEDWAAEV